MALEAVAKMTMGQSPRGSSYNEDGVGMPLIQGNADIEARRTKQRLWTTQPTKKCRAGDIIITVRAPVGHTAVASSSSCLGRGVCSLAAGSDNRFLFHALVHTEREWAVYEQGSTFTAVNSDEIRRFAIPWPPEPFQRCEIALALDHADDLVDALDRLIIKKQAMKQGLGEHIFAGQMRLSGFSGEWSDVALGDVATVEMGQSPPGSTYNQSDGLPLIQGNADIQDRSATGRVRTTQPIKICAPGDVILTVRAPVGFAAYAPHSACLGRGVCSLNAQDDNRFLFHSLVFAERDWAIYEQGSTFASVNSTEIRSFRLGWPADEDERASIARLLDAADEEIRVLKQRRAKAVGIKKGMMQELLSGRTCLPVAKAAA